MTDWKDVLGQLNLPEGDEASAVDAATNAEISPASDAAHSKPKGEKLNVALEKKGRGGKTATIIYGFKRSDEEVAEIASKLKRKLGIGGSARGGEILLQGDVREKLKPLLKEL